MALFGLLGRKSDQENIEEREELRLREKAKREREIEEKAQNKPSIKEKMWGSGRRSLQYAPALKDIAREEEKRTHTENRETKFC